MTKQTTPATETPEPGVGFVGCSRSHRVLRVRVASRDRRLMSVDCPDCGSVHFTAHSMARALRGDEPPPELEELPPDDAPATPTALTGRQRVSDAAIFDAIPLGRDVLASDVAAEAGYIGDSPTNSLTKRLHRMNARAEKEGAPPPFIVTPGGRYKAALVRRANQGEVKSTHG